MTENEAIIELKAVTEEEFQTENQEEAYKLAIQALEEIQQYRAIGMVERFRFLQEVGDLTGDELENLANSMIELKKYRAIGTIEEFKDLKEKSVAKKPIKSGIGYECVCCGSYTDPRDWHSAYCGRCGQKMNWIDCKLSAN